ncbi:hypothetical protein TcYC6_0119920 [Trypanosoma cruzi]|nr:hypothetical protein TcYC6_0119920 [Trypanosoma cruzi]
MNQVIRSRTDCKERVVFRLAWITASRWFGIAAFTPNNFTLEADGSLVFGLVRGTKDGEGGSPPRLAVRQDTRAGRVRHYKFMRDTSRKRKAHEYHDCPRGASSGSLGCHGAFHKTGCVAARCSNRGETQFGPTRDLAVGEARRPVRPSPEYSSIFRELNHNADPGAVAGRIDVKGEAAEGQEPWLKAEERFFSDFHPHSATITRRAPRTRRAVPFSSVLFYIR